MIPIYRGAEEPTLPAVRMAELTRTEALLTWKPRLEDTDFGKAYACARPLLRTRQHNKCCYCEKFVETKHEHVEHVRPKTVARRSDTRVDSGYWWLAWTWQNLLFCCIRCNTLKGTWYPLHAGHPLQPQEQPPGRERPRLLDPSVDADDPIAHIQFRRIAGRWIPTPRLGSLRGYDTIRRIQLDRSDLLELYQGMAEMCKDGIERIRGAMTGNSSDLQAVWRDVLRRWLQPAKYLAGLYYDVFDTAFPRIVRRHHGVSLDEFAGILTHRRAD